MPAILGVDPGFTGALALVDGPSVIRCWRVPLRASKGKPQVDLQALATIVGELAIVHGCTTAILEDVGAMPGQGVVSMFRFGLVTGMLRGILAANRFSTILIRPAAWKAVLSLPVGKDNARRLASHIFGTDQWWPLKRDHGSAEAALIGYVGQRLLKG